MENQILSDTISFSILMASYNLANYIEEAIESVISQTYPYWELIVVDDASIDNSVEKIKPFLKDKRIKLIIHKKNKGAGQAMITATKNASNTVLGILDCDDKLHKKALEIMAKEYRENPECGFIYSTHWICDSKLQHQRITDLNGPVDPEKTNLKEFRSSHFKTFRKDVYKKTKGFNPLFRYYCDGDISFKLEEYTKLKFVNIPLYYYRKRKTGASSKHKSQVCLEDYIAKLNAFHRRLNTNIPNLTVNKMYLEYYKCVFFKIVIFFTYLKEYFRFTQLVNKILHKFPNMSFKINIKLRRVKEKYFYWF